MKRAWHVGHKTTEDTMNFFKNENGTQREQFIEK